MDRFFKELSLRYGYPGHGAYPPLDTHDYHDKDFEAAKVQAQVLLFLKTVIDATVVDYLCFETKALQD